MRTVNLQQLQTGLSNYMDAEIISKAGSWDKLKLGFIKGRLVKQLPNMLNDLKQNFLFKDLFVNDMLDIEEVYSSAKSTIATTGNFKIGDIIFNETDIDRLYNYIINAII